MFIFYLTSLTLCSDAACWVTERAFSQISRFSSSQKFLFGNLFGNPA